MNIAKFLNSVRCLRLRVFQNFQFNYTVCPDFLSFFYFSRIFLGIFSTGVKRSWNVSENFKFFYPNPIIVKFCISLANETKNITTVSLFRMYRYSPGDMAKLKLRVNTLAFS